MSVSNIPIACSKETLALGDKAVDALARFIFAFFNDDPDWNDGYKTREQAVACNDGDLSQEECTLIAKRVLVHVIHDLSHHPSREELNTHVL